MAPGPQVAQAMDGSCSLPEQSGKADQLSEHNDCSRHAHGPSASALFSRAFAG